MKKHLQIYYSALIYTPTSVILTVWALLLFSTGCGPSPRQQQVQEWMNSSDKLKVLSTTGMVGDLVSQIGGDYVDNLVLITEQLDPHTYQLVKGDDEKLKRASLIFYSGLNLEHGPSLQNALRNNNKASAVGNMVVSHQPASVLNYGGQLDPHIWMDISLWSSAIPDIVAILSHADPQHAKFYALNGERTRDTMLATHQQLRDTLHRIPADKRFLVTSHDAFNYFTRAYLAEDYERIDGTWQKRFAAPEGLAPDSQLSTNDIQAIIDYLDRHHILVLFTESNVSKDSIRKIVDAGVQKGLHLTIATEPLYADAMGPHNSDGDTYLKMMTHNANVIAKHLDGNGKEARLQTIKRYAP